MILTIGSSNQANSLLHKRLTKTTNMIATSHTTAKPEPDGTLRPIPSAAQTAGTEIPCDGLEGLGRRYWSRRAANTTAGLRCAAPPRPPLAASTGAPETDPSGATVEDLVDPTPVPRNARSTSFSAVDM